eukprot:33775-Lingulodinium_polyedra.AAC.1
MPPLRGHRPSTASAPLHPQTAGPPLHTKPSSIAPAETNLLATMAVPVAWPARANWARCRFAVAFL